MRKFLKGLGWGLLALLVIGLYPAYRIFWGHPFTINQLANRQAVSFLVRNPELLTTIGLVDGTALDFHSGKLEPVGVAKRDEDIAWAERAIADVRAFDRARLDPQERITYDILTDFYGQQVAMKPFRWLSSEGLYPINPEFGAQVGLPNFMQSQHVIKNAKSARNYVARLQAMGAKLDALTAEMRRQSDSGVVLPPSLLEKSLLVINDTIAATPADNALVTTFVERMNGVKDIDAAARDRFRDEAIAAIEKDVYPAYRRMAEALAAERPKAATTADGVGRLKDGAAFYRAMLKQFTTTDYTPDQVHRMGLDEVARITAEMDTLLEGQGLADGTVAERMHALGKDPQYQFSNDEAGRKLALARYQRILDEAAARMPEYFRTIPAGKLQVVRVPVAAEKGSSGAYYEPAAMDGSRPGRFFANLRDMSEVPQWGMKTLAYHEGVPGHHFQIDMAHGLKDMPFIRQQPIYTAYVEGWALYAERLAAEIGMYEGDPLGDLGRLQAEMLRAARLVVDTGIHAKGWTRRQAIDYMVATTGIAESDVTSEVERYMSLPGQACAYKVGQLKILELREKARAALGPRFVLKDFHTVVLENGSVPLTELEAIVDAWIARGGGSP